MRSGGHPLARWPVAGAGTCSTLRWLLLWALACLTSAMAWADTSAAAPASPPSSRPRARFIHPRRRRLRAAHHRRACRTRRRGAHPAAQPGRSALGRPAHRAATVGLGAGHAARPLDQPGPLAGARWRGVVARGLAQPLRRCRIARRAAGHRQHQHGRRAVGGPHPAVARPPPGRVPVARLEGRPRQRGHAQCRRACSGWAASCRCSQRLAPPY